MRFLAGEPNGDLAGSKTFDAISASGPCQTLRGEQVHAWGLVYVLHSARHEQSVERRPDPKEDPRSGGGVRFRYDAGGRSEGGSVRIEQVVLRLVEMPLKFRFRTSFGEISVEAVPPRRGEVRRALGLGRVRRRGGAVLLSGDDRTRPGRPSTRFLVPLVLGRDVDGAGAFDAPRGARPREPDGEGGARDGAARPLRAGGGRLARAEPRRDARRRSRWASRSASSRRSRRRSRSWRSTSRRGTGGSS